MVHRAKITAIVSNRTGKWVRGRIGGLCGLLVVLCLVSSCIGVETEITFREDGTGGVVLTYRISRVMANVGTVEGDELIPLPVTEQDFRRSVESVAGLRLRRVTQSQDERDIFVKAEMDFDDIAAFSRIESFTDMPASLVVSDGRSVFSQVITSGLEQEVSEDSLELVSLFFDDYEIAFKVNAPGQIASHSMGELSENRRTVVYRVSVVDLLTTPERRVLTVSW